MVKIKRKRLTPTEIIESMPHPAYESAFMKIPGQLIDTHRWRDKESVWEDQKKILKILEKNPQTKGKYTGIHTHKTKEESFQPEIYRPSAMDLRGFLRKPQEKTMIVAVQNIKNGKILGYSLVRKTKNTLLNYDSMEFLDDLDIYNERTEAGKEIEALDDFCKKYHLQWGAISRTGEGSIRGKYNNQGLLEKSIRTISIIAIFSGIFFFSFNLTGNTISNLNSKFNNIIGIILFLLGIILGLFYFRDKLKLNKNKKRKK